MLLRDDDWSPLDATWDCIAHLLNTGEDDLIGDWRWRVWLDHKIKEDSALSGTEARETCERLLAEFQQARMMQQQVCVSVNALCQLKEKPSHF